MQLSQMASFVASFLSDFCVPKVNFVPSLKSGNPQDLQPIEFKRRRLSAPQLSLEWEQFMDMVEDPESTPTERIMLTQQLFRSFNSC